MQETIDAVVTWVDGSDPGHKAKRALFSSINDKDTIPFANIKWRFIEANEIKYCIYSIRKYARWVRNIFLVTDEQCPVWLTIDKQKELGVILIDHKIIFRDHQQFLPTFNTRSINTLLFKIPGLANNYIWFNDDFFIINKIDPEDFFSGENIVLRGQWKSQKRDFYKKIKLIIKHIFLKRKIKNLKLDVSDLQAVAARIVGFSDKYFKSVHAPHPSKVDVLAKYYSENPELLLKNIQYRFRNENQTSSSFICSHLMLRAGRAIIKDGSDSIMIIPRVGGLIDQRSKFESLNQGNLNGKKFLCFQDLVFLKEQNPEEFREIIEFLDKVILY